MTILQKISWKRIWLTAVYLYLSSIKNLYINKTYLQIKCILTMSTFSLWLHCRPDSMWHHKQFGPSSANRSVKATICMCWKWTLHSCRRHLVSSSKIREKTSCIFICTLKAQRVRFSGIQWWESILEVMLMLIPVFWHPTWFHIFLIPTQLCQGEITKPWVDSCFGATVDPWWLNMAAFYK